MTWYALTRADERQPWRILGAANHRGTALDIGGYYATQTGETAADSDPLLARLRVETAEDAHRLLGDSFDAALAAYRCLPGIPPDVDLGGFDGWFDEVVTRAEAARMLGITPTQVGRLVRDGALPVVSLPDAGIRRADVERYAARRKPPGRPRKQD